MNFFDTEGVSLGEFLGIDGFERKKEKNAVETLLEYAREQGLVLLPNVFDDMIRIWPAISHAAANGDDFDIDDEAFVTKFNEYKEKLKKYLDNPSSFTMKVVFWHNPDISEAAGFPVYTMRYKKEMEVMESLPLDKDGTVPWEKVVEAIKTIEKELEKYPSPSEVVRILNIPGFVPVGFDYVAYLDGDADSGAMILGIHDIEHYDNKFAPGTVPDDGSGLMKDLKRIMDKGLDKDRVESHRRVDYGG